MKSHQCFCLSISLSVADSTKVRVTSKCQNHRGLLRTTSLQLVIIIHIFRPLKKRLNLNFRKITIYNLWLMPKHTYIYWQYIIAILFFAGWVCHDNNDNCLLHFTILLILNGDDLAPKMWFSCQVIYVFFKKGTSQPWWEVVRFGGFCGFFRVFSFL